MEIFREVRRKVFGPSNTEIVESVLNLNTNGEYFQAKNTPPRVEILRPGIKHKHSLEELSWTDELGKPVSEFSEHTATFRRLVGCKRKDCNYRAIVSRRALY